MACIYCSQIVKDGKLKRHMKRNHNKVPEVKAVLSKPQWAQNRFFDSKRREGIHEFNVQQIAKGMEPKMRERQPKNEDNLRVCVTCKGYFSNKYFFKHQCTSQEKPQPLKPLLLQKFSESKMETDKEFNDLLNRFRDGHIGDLCRTDKTIKMIGYRHFNLRRHECNKQDEVRKNVMAEMRELSRLFVQFQLISGSDRTVEEMFSRDHLLELIEAINEMVKTDDSSRREKHGQKLFIDAIILKSIKTLKGHYSQLKEDDKVTELTLQKSIQTHIL